MGEMKYPQSTISDFLTFLIYLITDNKIGAVIFVVIAINVPELIAWS